MSVSNIVGTYLLSSSVEKSDGIEWYARAIVAAQTISNSTGVNVNKVAGVIAALSPNNRWDRNLIDAENVCKVYTNGDESDVLQVKVCTYGKMLLKAVQILQCDKVSEIPGILNGRKIRAFYECIVGKSDAVVVDGHAYSIWIGERLTMKQVPNIGIKLYASITADYIQATEEINAKFNTNLMPYQVQAITWVAWRRLHSVG
jgi:hypothetical protein